MKAGDVQPKADQPRVSTQSLTRPAAGIQYRVQGQKSYTDRTSKRPARTANRGY